MNLESEITKELKNEIKDLYLSLKDIKIPPIIHSSKTYKIINCPVKEKFPIRRDISLSDNDYVEQFQIVNEMLNSLDFGSNNNNSNNIEEISKIIKSYLNEYNMVLSNLLDSVSSYIQFQQDELNIMKESYDKLLIKSVINQDKINVYIRCRKPDKSEENDLKIIEINSENEKEVVFYGNADKFKYYEFDQCFDENSSQIDIFNELNYVIPSLLDGYNISIISYGIKGSGKSYTLFGESDKIIDKKLMMNGKIDVDSNIGLSFRILIDLYNYIIFNNYDSEMKVSVVELKNDEVYDVLHWYNSNNDNEENEKEDFRLNIICSNKAVEFPEINDVVIGDKRDIVKILDLCKEKRSKNDEIASTMFIYVCLKIKSVDKILESKLTIVDMIDSDKKITKSPIKIKEKSEYLYPSISSFNNIISHLIENRAMINYKENKLTLLLRDSFNGKSKTIFVFNIFTTLKYSDEINNTLTFANTLKNVQYGSKVNNFVHYSNQINEIRRLKKTIEDVKNGNGMNEEKDNEILLLEDMVDDLKEQIELYKGKDDEIVTLMKENNELKEKLVEFEENKMEIVRLKERITELEKSEEIIKEKEEEINELKTENEILNKTIESNKKVENSLKERIIKQNDQLTKSISNTNELKDMVEIQNQSLIEMKLIIETLQKRMKDMEIDLDKGKEIEKEKDNKIKVLEELIQNKPILKDCQTQTIPLQPRQQIPRQQQQQQQRRPAPNLNRPQIPNQRQIPPPPPPPHLQQQHQQVTNATPPPLPQPRNPAIQQAQQQQKRIPQQQNINKAAIQTRQQQQQPPPHQQPQQQQQQQQQQQRLQQQQSQPQQPQIKSQPQAIPRQPQIRKPPNPQQRQIPPQSAMNKPAVKPPQQNINTHPQAQIQQQPKQPLQPQNQTNNPLPQQRQIQPEPQPRIIPPRQSTNIQQQQIQIPPPPSVSQQQQPIRKLPLPQQQQQQRKIVQPKNINPSIQPRVNPRPQLQQNQIHPQQQQQQQPIRKPQIQQPTRNLQMNRPNGSVPQPRPRIQPPQKPFQTQQPFRNYLSQNNKII